MSMIINDKQETVRFSAQSLDDIKPQFAQLADQYMRTWQLPCALANAFGYLVAGSLTCSHECSSAPECAAARRRAIEESVRWGEPSVYLCPQGNVIWAVPVMMNSVVTGGVIVTKVEAPAGGHDYSPITTTDIRRAAVDLLTMTEEANLTNAALLELNRMAAQRESERAEAIHELKEQNYQSIRDIYLVEEPALIAAIKRGDRAAAREIINRVLVGIYYMGRDRTLLLKSFLLELVVMMSRSAVEAGGDPTELLGTNYSAFAELARIDSEEELCAWLVAMLEKVMDAIKASHHFPIGMLMGAALKYMQEHLHEELSRDDVAKVACLSPSHFSRVVKQTFNQSFTDLLAKMRVDKAREMLVLTEKNLLQICMDCGFSDQSYFTKVFQKFTGRTPGEYRRLHRSTL